MYLFNFTKAFLVLEEIFGYNPIIAPAQIFKGGTNPFPATGSADICHQTSEHRSFL
jgi:hypothetical protein